LANEGKKKKKTKNRGWQPGFWSDGDSLTRPPKGRKRPERPWTKHIKVEEKSMGG